ncbi:MAG: peptidoglycan-binding domain-containing protein [Actinomycetota bacterium]
MSIFLSMAEKMTYPNKSGRVPRRGDAPSRIVIHTTETARLPGYGEGSVAPHFTIGVGHAGSLPNEEPGKVRIWQHISLDRTASALRHDPGTIETNHMGAHCIQIECITYVGDQDSAGIVGNKGKFPKPLLKGLARLVEEITSVLGDIDLSIYPQMWSATGSYGANAAQRLTEQQWEDFNGICGHEHVPNNSHWDPGAFDIEAFLDSIDTNRPRGERRISTRPITSPPDEPLLFHRGDSDPRVRLICGVLQALGYGDLSSGPRYDSVVAAAVESFQKDAGASIDGVWGPETHELARKKLLERLAWYDDAE